MKLARHGQPRRRGQAFLAALRLQLVEKVAREARARCARTFTFDTDQLVISAISATEKPSTSSRVSTNLSSALSRASRDSHSIRCRVALRAASIKSGACAVQP